jgi:type IV secretory pathway VirB10-like protein
MPDNPLTPAPLPPVQRLSRAVLLVAAGLVTVTLLAVAFLATPKTLDHPQPLARTLATGDPGFLQHPPANPPAPSPEISEQEYLKRLWASFRHGAPGAPGAPGDRSAGLPGNPAAPGSWQGAWQDPASARPDPWAELTPPGGVGPAGAPPSDGLPGGVSGAYTPAPAGPPAPPPPPRDLRREAFLRALRAPLAPPAGAAPPHAPAPWPPLPAAESLGLAALGDREAARLPTRRDLSLSAPEPTSPLAERLRSLAAGAAAADAQPGDQVALEGAGVTRTVGAARTSASAEDAAAISQVLPTTTDVPTTTILPAGTVVSALLLTAVNSDLPGTLLAQVSRDVYDLHQRAVVLPRGTRLLGTYGDQVAVGQQRLLIAWTRLQLLDGTLLDLPGLAGRNGAASSDPGGAAGLPAQVHNHILRVFGDAILLSVLAAGADLSQPASTSALTAPSAGSVASAALGQQLSEAGTQLLRRDLAIQPTLTLPAGTPLTIFVNADLPLPAPAPQLPPAAPAAPHPDPLSRAPQPALRPMSSGAAGVAGPAAPAAGIANPPAAPAQGDHP